MQDSAGKQTLTNLIFQCFNGLKTYGKEPEQLAGVNGLFQFVLAEYPISKIERAFTLYTKHNSEMPAPADIVNIIERGDKPRLEKVVYVAISRKEPYERTSADWAYMGDYERFVMTGKLS